MKIRNGFVSNSSSSSYIVTLKNKTFDDFAGYFLAEGDYYNWDVEDVLKKLKDNIEENKTSEWNWIKETVEKMEAEYNEMKNIYEKKGICPELFKLIMKHYGITVKKEGEDLALHYFTSMHNSYTEGIGDLMKEIILFCCFENIKMEFLRESD